MLPTSERLTVLSSAERSALYETPDFDEYQRAEYLCLTPGEKKLLQRYENSATQIHCILQIGYFKAKQFFFRIDWASIEEDVSYIK